MGAKFRSIIKWLITSEARFSIMLACFAILFVIQPLANTFSSSATLLNIIYSLIMLSAVHNCVTESRKLFHFTVFLCVFELVGDWAEQYHDGVTFSFITFIVGAIIISVTVYYMLRHIISTKTIRFDTIAGAICIYLLIGMFGGFIFEFIEVLLPGSFSFPNHFNPDIKSLTYSGSLRERLTYFSYTTLTTLGFGDIVPVGSLARSLTVLLAILGQIYMTVAMAIIVGSFVSSAHKSRTFHTKD